MCSISENRISPALMQQSYQENNSGYQTTSLKVFKQFKKANLLHKYDYEKRAKV